ncbi:hypothetical protein EDB81DRAFT_763370 [Dactylonectria macrodidyma]|uniref:Uncharacterized protein n=1 Tax=Dactylonectria macrodidyma TaxID=307937 RepID=A0A9P9E858_9HYPO|nr:hypothetical protein EDB81DRAFT_763370 [Dactylonectria macrodidyma]
MPDPWNAIAIIGIRVYSKDAALELCTVMEGGELLQGGMGEKGAADLDDAQNNAAGARAEGKGSKEEAEMKGDINDNACSNRWTARSCGPSTNIPHYLPFCKLKKDNVKIVAYSMKDYARCAHPNSATPTTTLAFSRDHSFNWNLKYNCQTFDCWEIKLGSFKRRMETELLEEGSESDP